jgi:hypothetical protein
LNSWSVASSLARSAAFSLCCNRATVRCREPVRMHGTAINSQGECVMTPDLAQACTTLMLLSHLELTQASAQDQNTPPTDSPMSMLPAPPPPPPPQPHRAPLPAALRFF